MIGHQYRNTLVVLCRVTDPDMPFYGEPPTGVWRRYSEFELLRSYLEVMYPAIVVPPLPEKRVSVSLCASISVCYRISGEYKM